MNRVTRGISLLVSDYIKESGNFISNFYFFAKRQAKIMKIFSAQFKSTGTVLIFGTSKKIINLVTLSL